MNIFPRSERYTDSMCRSFRPPYPFPQTDLRPLTPYHSSHNFPTFQFYNLIFLPVSNHLSIPSNKHTRLQFEHSLNKPVRAAPLQPTHRSSPPWTLKQTSIRFDLTKVPSSSNTSYIRHIRCILDEYPNHTLCLSDGSESKHKSAYA